MKPPTIGDIPGFLQTHHLDVAFALMVLTLIVITFLWQKVYSIQRAVITRLLDDEELFLIGRNVLWALECARSAYPAPPLGIPQFNEYRLQFDRFRGETDSLTISCNEFLSRWLLLEGRSVINGEMHPKEKLTHKEKRQLCKQEALELIEDIRETLQHHERLVNLFVLNAQTIDPNFKLPTLLATSRHGISMAEEYIRNTGTQTENPR